MNKNDEHHKMGSFFGGNGAVVFTSPVWPASILEEAFSFVFFFWKMVISYYIGGGLPSHMQSMFGP